MLQANMVMVLSKQQAVTKTQLTHIRHEQTCEIQSKGWRCHRASDAVLNGLNLYTFSTLHWDDCVWLANQIECPILETVNTWSVPPTLAVLVLEKSLIIMKLMNTSNGAYIQNVDWITYMSAEFYLTFKIEVTLVWVVSIWSVVCDISGFSFNVVYNF